MSQYTQHGLPDSTKSHLEDKVIFGITKNHLIGGTLYGIIILIFTRLNWDEIVLLCF